jgi:hypothetical protein
MPSAADQCVPSTRAVRVHSVTVTQQVVALKQLC